MERIPEDRRLMIRYEDFVEQPKEIMASVLRFAQIKEPLDDAILASVSPATAAARKADARISSIGNHPVLERYGYGMSETA